MYKRDLVLLGLAAVAMLVSLQREGTVSFRKAWYYANNQEGLLVEHHLLPPPVLADLNGDGRLEVVIATPDLQIQVLAPAPAGGQGGGFAPAKLLLSASLLDRTVGSSAGRRPVALAVGYIDATPKDGLGVRVHRRQVVVVVTAGWQVLAYDHNLRLMWEKDMSGEQEQLTSHTHIKEVALLVTSHQVNAADRGLIVVGASLARGDLASGGGLEGMGADGKNGAVFDDEDVLSSEIAGEQRMAAHARSLGRTDALQDVDAKAGSEWGLDGSRHFSYHGLEGGSGTERWHHTATDFHKDLGELVSGMRPQHDYRLDANKMEGRHFGEASCRAYRESVLHGALPHEWAAPSDTRLAEARFVKHRASKGANKEKLGLKHPKGRQAHATATKGHLAEAAQHATPGLLGTLLGHNTGVAHSGTRGAGHTGAHAANISANAIVAHLEEGIEIIHLFSGRPVCQLHLQPGELHADLDGDGVMDHVQVFRGAGLSMDSQEVLAAAAVSGGRRHHGASHCTARAMSGIPPQHHLWEANICKTGRFNSAFGHIGMGLDEHGPPEILTPVFLPLPRASGQHAGFTSKRRQHGLVVVANSHGEVQALSSKGQHMWQSTYQVGWTSRHITELDAEEAAAEAPVVPTLKAIALHTHGVPTAVLVAGQDMAVVVSEHGHELATLSLPSPPTQPLVVTDFNGDGLTDIIAVTRDGGIYGWVQVQHLGGSTLPSILLIAVVGAGLVVWNSWSNTAGTNRKLRSTEYVD